MHSTVKENVMEHSEQVAQIAHALATINNVVYGGDADADRCVTLAVFHEASEVITGDLPTPIKYYNNEIKVAYKGLEGVANEKLLTMLPEEMRDGYRGVIAPDQDSEEYRIVKAADKLAAYIKCVEEMKSGNKEFAKALKTIEADIRESGLKEAEYFVKNFLPGFRLTLDELD